MPSRCGHNRVSFFYAVKGIFEATGNILQGEGYLKRVYKQDFMQVLSSYGGIFFQLSTDFPDSSIFHCQGVLKINTVRTNRYLSHPVFSIRF